MAKDKVRDDWANLASLAEVHEQDLPPSRRRMTKSADRLWVEIEHQRARIAELDDENLRLREQAGDMAEEIQRLRDELSPHDPAQIDALRHSYNG